MNTSNFAKHLVILTVLGLLAACGGGSSAPSAGVTAVISAAGGTVTGPDGVQVVIPPGALDQPTTIGIARSSAGAPTNFPEGITPTGSIYEFTPHDVIFNTPVTIRMPASGSAPSAEILMASPGGEWQVYDATVSAGFAEWQRNSFSWGGLPSTCAPSNDAPYSSGNPDPYPCSQPRGGATATATPASAITRRTATNPYGDAGSWNVLQASTVRLSINYQAVPDCENPRAKLWRLNTTVPQGMPGRVQTLFDGPVALTPTTLTHPPTLGGGTYVRGMGSTSHDVSFSHLDNGTSVFGYSFSCNRPFRTARSGGDLLTFVAAIPVPSVTYTIGGTVSGLTGTGLVLQNNGGDNRAVTADGAFTFATAIGAGAAYGVTVLTQPSGQTCTAQNGSGTANANVTNVAVSCVASPVGNWGAAVAISAVGKNASEPALGAAIDGYTTLAWVQHDTDQFNGYASRFDPANGWLGSELIENLATNTAQTLSAGVYSPRVTMGANQRAHIVFGFSSGQPGSYHTGMSRYTGSAWESNMLTFGGNSNDAALSFTGDGNTALMMYSQYDGATRYAIRSQAYQYGNNTLASLSPEGSATFGDSNSPAAAALGSSDAVGTWIAQSKFVYVNRFNGATQTWGVPVNLNASSTGNAFPPAIAGNAGGNAAVVWLDLNSGYRVYASRLSGAAWSTPVTLATQAEGAPRNFSSWGVSVATGLDTSGNTYFAWGQEDLTNPFTIRLYVSRCAIGQPMSACESRIQMDTRNDRMGRPGMAVAPNGDVWVAWVARTATGSEVRIRQRNSTGWSAVVTLGSSADTDVAPSIAIDGLNRVTVAWEGTDRRIYVARHH